MIELKYTLRRVAPHGFLITTKEQYDLAMLFVRCEEYYESPYEDINRKHFQLVELMHRYVYDTSDRKPLFDRRGEKVGKLFTYPHLWTGFNIPGDVILECLAGAPDRNMYDAEMLRIIDRIHEVTKRFYLIGVVDGDQDTFEHELAHVFFATEPKYRRAMTKLVDKLPIKGLIFNILRKEKYGPDHMIDEAQAYMATPCERSRMPKSNDGLLPGGADQFRKPFKREFLRWAKDAPVLSRNRVV